MGNYNPPHLSYPWTDLIKLRPQKPMDRSFSASCKLMKVLSHPPQSYFYLIPPTPPNFTVGGTVHHISHQLPQLSRPNKGFRHKREGHFQRLLNLQDHTTTSHKVIPCSKTPTPPKSATFTVGENIHPISQQPPSGISSNKSLKHRWMVSP